MSRKGKQTVSWRSRGDLKASVDRPYFLDFTDSHRSSFEVAVGKDHPIFDKQNCGLRRSRRTRCLWAVVLPGRQELGCR